MQKIFLPIYRYLHKHKILMYLLLVFSSLLFVFFGLKVKYEEDISKLLPTSSVESQLAFTSIELKDKIYIQVTSAGDRLSPEILAERTDEFVDLLMKKDSSGRFISNVLYKMEPEMALNALDFVLGHLPSFIRAACFGGDERTDGFPAGDREGIYALRDRDPVSCRGRSRTETV